MAMKGNLEMGREFFMEIWNGYERSRELEEENRKLKSDLAFERTMLDNVRAEYDSLQEIIKKLKEENEKLRIDREFEKGNTIFGM